MRLGAFHGRDSAQAAAMLRRLRDTVMDVVDLRTGSCGVLYGPDSVEGGLKAPNDLVFDAHGGFWFTDHGHLHAHGRDRGAVCCATPDGRSIARERIDRTLEAAELLVDIGRPHRARHARQAARRRVVAVAVVAALELRD